MSTDLRWQGHVDAPVLARERFPNSSVLSRYLFEIPKDAATVDLVYTHSNGEVVTWSLAVPSITAAQ